MHMPRLVQQLFRCNALRRCFIFGVFAFGLVACAGPSAEAQSYELSLMRYEQALRWQDYAGVVSFHKNAYKHADKQARKRFKKFKVTEYKTVSNVMGPDMRHATQTVEIRYYNNDYQIVHGMTLHNRWEYDPKTNHWYLLNPMPQFK